MTGLEPKNYEKGSQFEGAGVNRFAFIFWFLFVFSLSFGSLAFFGIVPEVLRSTTDQAIDSITERVPFIVSSTTKDAPSVKSLPIENTIPSGVVHSNRLLPERIVIASIGLDSIINNPKTTSIDVLDTLLQEGVVRYPGSATLSDDSNMLLFGHSSYLRVVHNQNYRVFNKIKDLKKGQEVKLQSNGVEYLYSVTSVRLTTAEEALVSFSTGKKRLTLSTCNSFGEKDERYVVEADFVKSYPVAN